MANLGPQLIKDSYESLLQITSSNTLQKGDGTIVSTLDITSSVAAGIAPAITNNVDNRILTATGGGTINGESGLTFNGSDLTLYDGSSTPINVTIGTTSAVFSPPATSSIIIGGTNPLLDLYNPNNTVQTNDLLGAIRFRSNDTPLFTTVKAQIAAYATDTSPDGYLVFSTQQNTSPSALVERMRITNTGLIGIGTTTPTTALEVNGGITATDLIATNSASFGSGFTPTARVHISGASDSGLFEIDSPALNNIIYVSGSGNVGIGTATPNHTLDVNGNINTNASLIGNNLFVNRARVYYTASFGASGIDFPPTAIVHISGASADNLFRASSPTNTNIFVISGSGNVGIGTTSPSTTLQVAGTSSLQNIIFDTNNIYDIGTSAVRVRNIWSNNNVVGTTSYFTSAVMYNSARIGGEHTATALLHISGSDSAQMMRINSPSNANILFVSGSGQVGIGVTTPSARLHVSGASNSALFEIDSPAVNNIIYVSGSGNVGIGTSNPLSKLHISASSGNEFLRITSGSQNILNVRSGSAVFFAGTGVAPSSGFDLDIQGTGTVNGGSARIAGNGTVWGFGSVSSVNRTGTGNSDMFNVTMGGTSATLIQNPMSIQFNANQNATSGSGYIVLRLNATHASTAGTGSKLLQTWEFAGTQRSVVNITGSIGVGITTPSASIHISSSLGLPPMLALTPHHPLPTIGVPVGSFMVSSSVPPRPFMWDGTSWYAL